MAALLKALSRPSSYAAKKTTVWADVADRIAGVVMPDELEDVEAWLDANAMLIPPAWDEHFAELIEKRRDELRSEDVGASASTFEGVRAAPTPSGNVKREGVKWP